MRIVFMGTPDFSVPVLAAILAAGHEIAAVYSQPPRRGGRGMAETKSPVHVFAEQHGLPVLTPKNFKDPADRAAFAAHNADAAVVVAYGLLLPEDVLITPHHGCFNVHASRLPRWRGAAPIQRAIMAGDASTAVQVMCMEKGLDTGPICLSREVPIGPVATAGELHDQLSKAGAELIVAALEKLASGTLEATPQASEGVTYAAKIDKAETRIDFNLPAEIVAARIRGLSPFPGAWVPLGGGEERLKVLHAHAVDGSGSPGEVLGGGLVVACASGAVSLDEVQRAGKRPVAAAEFLRGYKVKPGDRLG